MRAYDFVFDACGNGQQLKYLAVLDEDTCKSLAIDVSASLRSARVVEVPAQLISVRGAPQYLRTGNGPEYISRAPLYWAAQNQLEMALINPGKPWQNGIDESFNGKYRDECLSAEWFRIRNEAKAMIGTWQQHYNEIQPHSRLGQRTPGEFARELQWIKLEPIF